ncbi:conserved hypothetical protein [Talaromyces stipitatus ATCC 10500]|uniref:Uncharacterized protein n=1 Tax=Talaromyces stipitatus (strain ATCC 10500 / CBS 375.48 / QM 6759 / NRRL 1006) TaxID=441959 RepID=B8MBL3_TALSN|nr:uncharacterized protein TSTA_116660 [Talaromyces stipitatus ATCC 10500]EED17877.1 conserved hypothetical protein [Talaromyces stipitatus ATCC 10500]
MRTSTLLVAALAATVSTAKCSSNVTIYRNESFLPGNKLPESHITTDGKDIVNLFVSLTSSTKWTLISKTKIEGDTGEPEGMVRVGDQRLFVTSNQYTIPTVKYNKTINGTDRTPGAGFSHMLIYDLEGRRIANASLTAPGDIEYHGGGIDYDGRYVWITLAQYRPNTTATIARIDPLNLKVTRVFRTADHNGGIIHDTITNELVTLNWNGQNATTWSLNGYPKGFTALPSFTYPLRNVPNPSHHTIPTLLLAQACCGLQPDFNPVRSVMLCGGVGTFGKLSLGGMALVDTQTMLPLWEVPITLTSDLGVTLTENPVDVQVVDGKLRVWFMPDQHNSTLYVYEAN